MVHARDQIGEGPWYNANGQLIAARLEGEMSKRMAMVVLCVTAAPGVVSTAAAQARASDAGKWEVPRTPDGHPDLQGNWTNATLTPFEREEEQESPVLTWEQVQELQGNVEARIERGARPSDPDRPAPRAGGSEATGSVGGYNNVYMDRGTNIAIVNGEFRSSLLTNPPDGRRPDLTPEGERRVAAYRALRDQFEQYDHPEVRGLGERCIMSFGSSAGPPMIPNTAYNNNYTIVQTADHIMIMSEMVHDARIIRIGDGPRLPPHVRPWMGDSWGSMGGRCARRRDHQFPSLANVPQDPSFGAPEGDRAFYTGG